MMIQFLIRRVLFGVAILWLVSTAVFILTFAVPTDPASVIAGPRASQDVKDQIAQNLGLDDPMLVQYGRYLWDLLQFDLGESYINGVPVLQLIEQRLPATAWLVLGASVLWLLGGVITGVLSATRARSLLDRATTLMVLTGISMPTFVFGLVLIYFFYFQMTTLSDGALTPFEPGPFVPLTEDPLGFLQHMILPWITLAMVQVATYTRLTRSSMLDVLGEDYIRTARAKGLSERRVVYRHGLRAGMTPVVTQFGVDVGQLLGGVLVTESVFGLQGIGQMVVSSLDRGDVPVITGVAIVAAFCVVAANLTVDIAYSFLDPRVRVA